VTSQDREWRLLICQRPKHEIQNAQVVGQDELMTVVPEHRRKRRSKARPGRGAEHWLRRWRPGTRRARGLAVVEAVAETAHAQAEREASATRKRAEELEDSPQAAQVTRPRLTRCMSCNDIECSVSGIARYFQASVQAFDRVSWKQILTNCQLVVQIDVTLAIVAEALSSAHRY
jgi:hypothetical protein